MSTPAEARCRRCGIDLSSEARFCPRCGTRRSRYLDAGSLGIEKGWYRDPFGGAGTRYFDGQTWTDLVHTDRPGRAVAPVEYAPSVTHDGAWTGTFGSLALSLLGLGVAFGLSFLFVLPLLLTGRPGGAVVEVVLSEAGLWLGLSVTCWLESRRYGSGSIPSDFRLRLRASDVAVAFGACIAARALSGVVLIPFIHDLGNPDGKLYSVAELSLWSWAVFAVVVCVGAPLFEELFFRGLVQGQLVERFGPFVGIGVTSIVFGAVHFFNDPGIDGALLALSVGAGGIVLGTVRYLTGRLGTSMMTHALFNLAPTLLLLSLVGTQK